MKNLTRTMRHSLIDSWHWAARKGVLALIIVLGTLTFINAQMSGSRGGLTHHQQQTPTAPKIATIPKAEITDVVTVRSSVELRVAPDQIRIVLAITDDGKTSTECETKVFEKIQKLKKGLESLGIPSQNIVDDFIAVLPEYKYEVETMEGTKVAAERLYKFNMQSNLHIKVENDVQAMKAIREAFKQGVTDIIAFDYWSKELDDKKAEALSQAIVKTKAKSKLLMDETFEKSLEPINVTSATRVVMPDGLYQSFSNSYSQTLTQQRYGKTRDLPVIKAVRPKNTYYKGYFNEFGDQHSPDVPMRSEITVVAEVEMHYASPVAKEYRQLKAAAENK